MSPRRIVCIANPCAQNGLIGRRWREVSAAIGRELGSFAEVMTKAAGEATTLARRALREGADVVIAVGGDGTLHEVANGFFVEGGSASAPGLVNPNATLGIVPLGTGGDFRRTLSLPKDAALAARVISGGVRRLLDVGLLGFTPFYGEADEKTHRVFINIASFGIGGVVDRIVNQSSKLLGGRVSFLLGTARAALSYKNQLVRLAFDDNAPEDMVIHNVAVANGRYFGGGMHIAPNAVIDDGLFDVIVLGDLGRVDLLTKGHRVYQGTHLGLSGVTARRARSVTAAPVNSSDEVLLDVDGEAPGKLPATFTVLERVLPVLAPSPG